MAFTETSWESPLLHSTDQCFWWQFQSQNPAMTSPLSSLPPGPGGGMGPAHPLWSISFPWGRVARKEEDAPHHPSNPQESSGIASFGFLSQLMVLGRFTGCSDNEEELRINFYNSKSVKNLAFSHYQHSPAKKLHPVHAQEMDGDVFWGRKACHKHVVPCVLTAGGHPLPCAVYLPGWSLSL